MDHPGCTPVHRRQHKRIESGVWPYNACKRPTGIIYPLLIGLTCDVDDPITTPLPVQATQHCLRSLLQPVDTQRCLMSVLTDWGADWSPPISTRLRAGVAALGIAVTACVTGVVGIVVAGTVLRLAGVLTVPAVSALRLRSIQVGFAVFAAAFLAWRSDIDHYCKLRLPTLEDAAWIIFIPLVFAAQGVVLSPVLAALGLPHPDPVAETGHLDLAAEPLLWPAAFVGMFVFAAPAEELVYRGIIQGTLRKGFDLAGTVVIGGLLFGLMHVLVGIVTPNVGTLGALRWGMTTALPGMVWGYAYERTENLTVTAITHAMTWTVTVHELVLNLVPL